MVVPVQVTTEFAALMSVPLPTAALRVIDPVIPKLLYVSTVPATVMVVAVREFPDIYAVASLPTAKVLVVEKLLIISALLFNVTAALELKASIKEVDPLLIKAPVTKLFPAILTVPVPENVRAGVAVQVIEPVRIRLVFMVRVLDGALFQFVVVPGENVRELIVPVENDAVPFVLVT